VGRPPTLLINRTPDTGHAAIFKLVGTKSNQAAIGARVTATTGGVAQISEVYAGSSYLSQNDLRLHFGFGQKNVIDTVEVSWPSGKKDVIKDLPTDFIYTLVEGEGVKAKTPFSVSAPIPEKGH
jgi:hypothetical protein